MFRPNWPDLIETANSHRLWSTPLKAVVGLGLLLGPGIILTDPRLSAVRRARGYCMLTCLWSIFLTGGR